MHIKYIILFLIPNVLSGILKGLKVVPLDEVKKKLMTKSDEGKIFEEIISNLIGILEPYVFQDIAKNPPKVKNKPGYFQPTDVIEKLKSIPTSGTDAVDFIRNLRRAFGSLFDGHLSFSLVDGTEFEALNKYFILHPLILRSEETDGIAEIKGSTLDKLIKVDYELFDNGLKVKEIIQKNENIGINSINGISPFEWIESFYREYFGSMKNINAFYSYALDENNLLSFSVLPLQTMDLSHFDVVYNNGDSFKTNILGVVLKIAENEDFLKFYKKAEQNFMRAPKSLLGVIREYEKNNQVLEKNSNEIEWDARTEEDELKCRVDKENKLNVLVTSSFSYEDVETFIEILVEKCLSAFNENDFPVVIITSKNTGGISLLSILLVEIVQQLVQYKAYTSFRNTESMRKFLNEKFSNYYDRLTCEEFKTVDEMFESPETDDYGNEVIHKRLKMVLELGKYDRKMLEKYKSISPKKRIPTDIIVFTDGRSFSSGSLLLKSFKNFGIGITVGYNGNPQRPKSHFDVSQSTAGVLLGEEIRIFNESAYDNLIKLGINVTGITFSEDFGEFKDEVPPIPEEYTFNEVDERVPIYYSYTDEKYEVFMQEAKRIYKKYKTRCNPRNKNLLLVNITSDECQSFKDDPLARGGYLCGDDGKWSKVCAPLYCTNGYDFDRPTNKCVKNPCNEIEENSSSSKNSIKENWRLFNIKK